MSIFYHQCDVVTKIPDWPTGKADAEFRLCVGHDCLGTQLHRTGIRPDPNCMLCSLREPMDNVPHYLMWPGSSVGIATELRAGRSGFESRWERDFPPIQTGPGTHPASCKIGTGSSPGVNCGRGVLLTTHPLLVPRSWKSRAIPLPTLWATQSL